MKDPETSALVLVADDSPANLQLLTDLLTPEGVDVAVARDGLQVLKIVHRHEPDLILLDALMPDLDGFETCRRLKANPKSADIPVILMTSLTETRYKLQGFSVGAIDYVTKPFEHAELLARVRTQISLRNATRALQEKNSQLELRTEELRQAQARLIALEKEDTEVRMAGGFAHEMRNALSGARMLIGQVYHGPLSDGAPSLCLENSYKLKELYLHLKEYIPPEKRAAVVAMLREINANEQTTEAMVRGVAEALDRALASTQAILEYARLGRERRGSERVLLRPLVESILRESEGDFATHGITVNVSIAPSEILTGREIHFYSILKNLILNARDALLEKEDKGARLISISLTEEGDSHALRVADTGPGIPPEDRERIFEPFFTRKPQHGTGLGLGVIRKLVALYQGTVDVESQVDRGTTFRVSLPRV